MASRSPYGVRLWQVRSDGRCPLYWQIVSIRTRTFYPPGQFTVLVNDFPMITWMEKTEYVCSPRYVTPEEARSIFAGWWKRLSNVIRHFTGMIECIDSEEAISNYGLVIQTVGPDIGRDDPRAPKRPRVLISGDYAILSEVKGHVVEHFDRGSTYVTSRIEAGKAYRGCVHYPEETGMTTATLAIGFFPMSL